MTNNTQAIFDQAAKVEPKLLELENFVAMLPRGDLDHCSLWHARFRGIVDGNAQLEKVREQLFEHLANTHREVAAK